MLNLWLFLLYLKDGSRRFMAPLRVRTDGDVPRDDGENHKSMGADLYKCCWGRFFGDKSSPWGRLMG